MSRAGARFHGKYRGTVADNLDPLQQGRLRLKVPNVLGKETSTWALPCVPIAGAPGSASGLFALPDLEARVWVEFEDGEMDHPIWVGCFWDENQVTPMTLATPSPVTAITFQTRQHNGLTISDAPGAGGGIVIESAGGATLIVNDSGITIDNGAGATIKLQGGTVSINGDALEVT
ncbi:MAG: hypothetical protein JWQ90_3003 [Hydrocarboniphaga sp.]|uniref:phage baseplate assembly protein V n=1 Tax=Hydrocarboniphaga sp. TaxID=2033016 RepID=UPI002635A625|nr:phage baseplate assembly protein V [Hydrocarboniphaga sp.]MDB5970553.1 hypothetical protein [Hydrocarboniphaga sp.]